MRVLLDRIPRDYGIFGFKSDLANRIESPNIASAPARRLP
jgi:hypothetical protein